MSTHANHRRSATAPRVAAILVVALGLSCLFATASRAADESTAERDLLAKYAPVLASPRQTAECKSGEPFFPVAVDAVLGREDVVLRDERGRVITTAPTVRDLVSAGPRTHLDFPGRALKPGCAYEKWFDSLNAEPAMYGRVVSDPDHPDRIVLQYWFFWVYNNWNDRHEGDWEMMQLIFNHPDVAGAADDSPDQVMVAQHEGGEIQQWDSIAVWDDSPLVFPAAGSHATYYSPQRWLGTDAQSGFGCDDTRTPSAIITPKLIVMPTVAPESPDDPFAWLSWEGRWGEKQPSFNNGPTGPVTKHQWSHPVTWYEEEGREGSFALPPLGTPITNVFCSLTTRASLAMFEILDRPWISVTIALVVVAIIGWAVRRTKWRPTDPRPIDATRATGAIWMAGLRLLTVRWKSFLPFAVALFVAGSGVRILQHVVYNVSTSTDLSAILDDRGAVSSILVTTVWGVITLPLTAVVLACISTIFNRERTGSAPLRSVEVIRMSLARSVLVPSFAFTVLMLFTVLPVYQLVAFFLAARWMVAPMAAAHPHPFAESARLTKGRRGRTIRIGLITLFVSALLGPTVGTILLVTTTWPLGLLNTISAFISAALLPWAMVTMGFVHADLVARRSTDVEPTATA